jgi:hypothetical protein
VHYTDHKPQKQTKTSTTNDHDYNYRINNTYHPYHRSHNPNYCVTGNNHLPYQIIQINGQTPVKTQKPIATTNKYTYNQQDIQHKHTTNKPVHKQETKMDYDLQTTIVIDNEEIFDYINDYFYPEDVFSEEKLKIWAEENGYILTD